MANFQMAQMALLAEKIQKLFQLTDTLKTENARLKKALDSGKTDAETIQRLMQLEQENIRLKKENKLLKEREKLIRNKTERLAVKLEEIDL